MKRSICKQVILEVGGCRHEFLLTESEADDPVFILGLERKIERYQQIFGRSLSPHSKN